MHAVLVDQSSYLTLWAKHRAACVRRMELPMPSSCCCLVDVPLIPNTGRQKLPARLGPWSLTLLCTCSLAACCLPVLRMSCLCCVRAGSCSSCLLQRALPKGPRPPAPAPRTNRGKTRIPAEKQDHGDNELNRFKSPEGTRREGPPFPMNP